MASRDEEVGGEAPVHKRIHWTTADTHMLSEQALAQEARECNEK